MSTNNATKPNPKWAPTYYTERKYDDSDGKLITDFAYNWLTLTKGMRAGQPLEFMDWQEWLLGNLLERRTDGRLRYRRALVKPIQKRFHIGHTHLARLMNSIEIKK